MVIINKTAYPYLFVKNLVLWVNSQVNQGINPKAEFILKSVEEDDLLFGKNRWEKNPYNKALYSICVRTTVHGLSPALGDKPDYSPECLLQFILNMGHMYYEHFTSDWGRKNKQICGIWPKGDMAYYRQPIGKLFLEHYDMLMGNWMQDVPSDQKIGWKI